jgi:hypothetical protein
MSVKIIILQTSREAIELCKKEFEAPNCPFKDEEYFLTRNPGEAAAAAIDDTIKQLFVMGTFHGDRGAADYYAITLKQNHLNLVLASFSTEDMSGSPYEKVIKKTGGRSYCANLFDAMAKFLKTENL